MNGLPESIQNLIESLRILPGIGEKTAARMAFFLLKKPNEVRQKLGNSILECTKDLQKCEMCGHFATSNICEICNNPTREENCLCIVEDSLDLLAIERTKSFKGRYHVLGGALAPLDGIGPDDLNISFFEKRLEEGKIEEIIIATNPSLEGEATAALIQRKCENFPNLKLTRIARGIPVGGDVEYADEVTLSRALENRIQY